MSFDPHRLIAEKPFSSYSEYLQQYANQSPVLKARRSDPDGIIREIKDSGLRGRGGAGFPTGIKWASLKNHPCKKRYVVCNASEGEPGTFKDRYLFRKNPYATIEGMIIAAHVLGTSDLYLAIKGGYAREIARLENALVEIGAAGLLKGINLKIVHGPDSYLYGEEKALLEVVEGNEPMPRETHYPPFEKGLFASIESPNPALVSNAESFARVPGIIFHGATSFRALGTKDTPGRLIFTVCGDVAKQGLFELEAGITLRELFNKYAGGPKPGRRFKAMISGVASGVVPESKFDTPADFGSLAKAGGGLGSAGFIVMDDSVSIPRAAQALTRFLYVESCHQCASCKSGLREASMALDDFCANRPGKADPVERALSAVIGGSQTTRCFLPVEGGLMLPSFIREFRDEFLDPAKAAAAQPYPTPKIKDYDEERNVIAYDSHYDQKRPDWTYAPELLKA
ncbi:MAG: NADH-ubiquinone oxidoreductase-F iron-sulfur binding region domain-containing protein [Elusimicrobiota bacterium]